MKRILFGLPLAGAMTLASMVFAQTPAPTNTPPPGQAGPSTQTAPTTQDEVQPERGDCVNPPAAENSASTDEMQAAVGGGAGDKGGSPTPANPSQSDAPARSEGEEESASESKSETQPVTGPDAGTAPGGSGSSGWTGGFGGSNTGTSQSEELDSSPHQNPPEVAAGLDPISGETAVTGPAAPPPADDGAQTTPTAPKGENAAAARARPDC